MLSAARCEKCNRALPLRGELFDFRLPPDSVRCPACGNDCSTILPYRVGWMEALVHKVLVVVSVPLSLWLAFAVDRPVMELALYATLGPLVGGGLGGFVLSKLLGMPLTLLRDVRRRSRAE
jgi:hypothetical protein